jgi:hypothetical protein
MFALIAFILVCDYEVTERPIKRGSTRHEALCTRYFDFPRVWAVTVSPLFICTRQSSRNRAVATPAHEMAICAA